LYEIFEDEDAIDFVPFNLCEYVTLTGIWNASDSRIVYLRLFKGQLYPWRRKRKVKVAQLTNMQMI